MIINGGSEIIIAHSMNEWTFQPTCLSNDCPIQVRVSNQLLVGPVLQPKLIFVDEEEVLFITIDIGVYFIEEYYYN